VHHGDGVQAVFYDDPRVLTISLHESGRYLFPGSGFADETGAQATSVNVALPPGTRDAEWLRAFDAVVPPLLRAFRPDVLVTQHGCDSHLLDPLAHLALTIDGQRASYAALHDLAHELTDGKWIACGGGGYELVQVVPRVWTHLLAEVAGARIPGDTETPDEWRAFVSTRTGAVAPTRMTDDGVTSFAPYDPQASGAGAAVDTAIAETRLQVFPPHGLDPLAA
jgi:acetoin utilization deacetylase AcuC-like enzyme